MKGPLFILAPPRSFTSVVCGMIGQHPELFGLPEVNLFGGDDLEHLSRWYRMRPRFQHGLLRAVAELGLGGQLPEDVVAAKQWLSELDDLSTGEVYQSLAEWADPRMLVDKSPMYVYDPIAYTRMIEAFPDARFLHLLRHPRGTCESLFKLRQEIQEGGGQAASFEINPDKIWRDPHVHIVEFLETIAPEQQLRVKGEDFLSNPDIYLKQICEWLGVRSDDDAIEAMKHPENSPFACMGPDNARFGNDPSFLQNPVLRDYKAKPFSLDGALSYDSNTNFSETTRHYASLFGYA